MRITSLIFALLVLIPNIVFAGTGTNNAGKFSVGYSGMLTGSFLQGISTRMWMSNKLGVEGNVTHARINVDDGTDDADAKLTAFTIKLMYSPVIKNNSRFYFGLEGGYGVGQADGSDDDLNITIVSPLIGVEYHLSGIPELGLNWEVSYKYNHLSSDGTDYEVDISGIGMNIGAHYYF